MINRRDVLKGAAASAAMISVPGVRLRVAHAATGGQRLAVLILRGGLDGLSVVPPYGDSTYYDVRPRIAVPSPHERDGALDLDGKFGLNPAMSSILPFFRRNELLFVQAVGTQHHTRSHFDAQDMLENGTSRPHGSNVGWLNRALDVITPSDGNVGLALGHTVPLLIRGPTAVRTWAPRFLPKVEEDFLDRLSMLYSRDKLLRNAFVEGRESASIAGMVDQK